MRFSVSSGARQSLTWWLEAELVQTFGYARRGRVAWRQIAAGLQEHLPTMERR